MGRYVARKVGGIGPVRSYWMDDAPMLPSLCAPDSLPVNTGLLDAHGNELWRRPNPVGFGKDTEWSD